MGSEKALLDFEGEPLVLRVARRLATVCDPVLLATGTVGRLGDLGYAEVADVIAGAGPLAGLAAALEASPHEALAVAAVDMPDVSPDLFLLLAGLRDDEDAVVPVSDRGPEPLHAVYAHAALPAIASYLAAGDRSVRGLLAKLRVREVNRADWQVADPSGAFATNLNRPPKIRPVVKP